MESSLLPVAMSYSMRIAFHMFGVEQSQLPLLGPSGNIWKFLFKIIRF